MLKAIRPAESRAEYGLEKFVGFAQWGFTNRTYIIRQCDEKSMVGLIQSLSGNSRRKICIPDWRTAEAMWVAEIRTLGIKRSGEFDMELQRTSPEDRPDRLWLLGSDTAFLCSTEFHFRCLNDTAHQLWLRKCHPW
jgi:hypothetical protein